MEQNVRQSLAIADRAYVLENGRMVTTALFSGYVLVTSDLSPKWEVPLWSNCS